jgi:hypothetical protein
MAEKGAPAAEAAAAAARPGTGGGKALRTGDKDILDLRLDKHDGWKRRHEFFPNYILDKAPDAFYKNSRR